MTIKSKVVASMIAIFAMVSVASATITDDLADFTQIIGNTTSGLTGWVVSMMALFMEPPLLYFVTIGIFVTIVGIVAGLLLRRGRRR